MMYYSESMNIDLSEYKTPGQLISALLEQRGWTARTLAVVMGVDETGLNKIIAAKRGIDAKTAIILEEVFGIEAEDFLKLQKTYDLAVARIEARPDPKRKTRAQLYGDLPVAAMIKRGWLNASSVKDTENLESSLCRFFGVNRIDDVEILPHAAKRTEVSVSATPAQLAWIYRVKTLAEEMMVGRYSAAAVQAAIKKIQGLLYAPEELRNVPRILAEAGIRFVIVEALPSSKIDGVCFWLDDTSPVIGMTLRFDRIDNFCFVLRHELEHVLNRDGLTTAMLDVDIQSANHEYEAAEIERQERMANEAAAEFCVPKKMMDAFISRKAPIFAERDIIGLSRMIKVHPGLIAGQLQHRTGEYNKFRQHLVPVRKIVTPNAVTDGWGDIASAA
jgi:HTH-type transcriptional regulator/antitoxin HigA